MGKKKPSLYEILGVDKGATDADLKKAYRAAAKEAHPDAGGTSAEFEAVKTAMVVLSNKGKRKKYDETGEVEDDRPSTIDQQAVGILAQLMNNVLGEDPDPLSAINLVEMMMIFVQKQIEAGEKNLAMLRRAKGRAERMRKRFKKKSKGGENMLAHIIESKIKDLENMIPMNEKGVAAHRRAMEMLADYSFDPEAQTWVPSITTGTGSYGRW